MFLSEIENKEKNKKEMAKMAIGFAMKNLWKEAIDTNLAILRDCVNDLEAQNRLGKAYSELGRNRESREAFQRALDISPYNGIAKKNLERLSKLGEDSPNVISRNVQSFPAFIRESGKSTLTSLVNLGRAEALVKSAPGHTVELKNDEGRLNIVESSGVYLGQIEPKLGNRLIKLLAGGNRYDATVTSVTGEGLKVIIREIERSASQASIVSFPSGEIDGRHSYVPGSMPGANNDELIEPHRAILKDWTDDDTEPGDDEAYSPVVHRIIKASEDDLETDIEKDLDDDLEMDIEKDLDDDDL